MDDVSLSSSIIFLLPSAFDVVLIVGMFSVVGLGHLAVVPGYAFTKELDSVRKFVAVQWLTL